jgi:hypothetical protein
MRAPNPNAPARVDPIEIAGMLFHCGLPVGQFWIGIANNLVEA